MWIFRMMANKKICSQWQAQAFSILTIFKRRVHYGDYKIRYAVHLLLLRGNEDAGTDSGAPHARQLSQEAQKFRWIYEASLVAH